LLPDELAEPAFFRPGGAFVGASLPDELAEPPFFLPGAASLAAALSFDAGVLKFDELASCIMTKKFMLSSLPTANLNCAGNLQSLTA
jgi:hypothetical protein